MQYRFYVDRDPVCPGIRECFEVRIAWRDHQVNVGCLMGVTTHCFDNIWSHRDVGHEVAVHYVHVYPVGARGIDSTHFFAETREIGGKFWMAR